MPKTTSKDPTTCNSGVVTKGKTCDWKAWGLFRTMGHGVRLTVLDGFLDNPVVYKIFTPLELELDSEEI